MATVQQPAAIHVGPEVQAAVDRILKAVRYPEAIRQATERMDRMRNEMRQRVNSVDLAVPLIHGTRDESKVLSMPRVWWCNQTRCWDDERPASLVCSHVTSDDGRQKYRRMVSEARAGDITVHYRSGRWKRVVAISRALTDPVEDTVDLRQFGVTGTVCWQTPKHGWRFEAEYHDFGKPIPKGSVIEELDELEIEDGPIESPGRIRQAYFMRFSVEGLRILRRASAEAWPEWAEAAFSSRDSTNYYFYNTDGKSLGEPRPRFRTLIDNGFAATGGERHFGEKLGQLAAGDILLMYENRMGVVAIGTVTERWDGISHRDLLYYKKSIKEIGAHGHEYRIDVDWFLDLTDHPIGIGELREWLGYIPRGTVRKIVSNQADVERMIEERRCDRQASFRTYPAEIGESILVPPERVDVRTTRIVRDTAEARRLKKLYESRCQICGERIELDSDSYYAEVHHIRPLGGPHRGLDSHDNMLVVCPTHHAMLDLGVAMFSSERCVSIGGRLLPITLKHRLASENLDYHNEGIVRRRRGSGSAGGLGEPLGSSHQ